MTSTAYLKWEEEIFLYILKLEKGRWYVGLTKYPEKIVEYHCDKPESDPPRFSQKYPMVELAALYKWTTTDLISQSMDQDDLIEKLTNFEDHAKEFKNYLTLHLMHDHGDDWKKVRGGKWCRLKLKTKPSALEEFAPTVPNCQCGLPAALKMSKTVKNPGRQFYTCCKVDIHMGKVDFDCEIKEKCKFFAWYDDKKKTTRSKGKGKSRQ